MADDATTGAGLWLAAYMDMSLPADQLPAAVASTCRASASIGAQAKALAMEDEPASFTAALERLAVAKR